MAIPERSGGAYTDSIHMSEWNGVGEKSRRPGAKSHDSLPTNEEMALTNTLEKNEWIQLPLV